MSGRLQAPAWPPSPLPPGTVRSSQWRLTHRPIVCACVYVHGRPRLSCSRASVYLCVCVHMWFSVCVVLCWYARVALGVYCISVHRVVACGSRCAVCVSVHLCGRVWPSVCSVCRCAVCVSVHACGCVWPSVCSVSVCMSVSACMCIIVCTCMILCVWVCVWLSVCNMCRCVRVCLCVCAHAQAAPSVFCGVMYRSQGMWLPWPG